jgi:hypothetical protein
LLLSDIRRTTGSPEYPGIDPELVRCVLEFDVPDPAGDL